MGDKITNEDGCLGQEKNQNGGKKPPTGGDEMVDRDNATLIHSNNRDSGMTMKFVYVSISPFLKASKARTSVTYCMASRIGMRFRRSLSVGSLIQPWIGMALSRQQLIRKNDMNV